MSIILSPLNFCLACNILLQGLTDVYTLRNYGKPVNCSLTTLYPAQVKILALGVGLGHGQKRTPSERETGTIHKVSLSFSFSFSFVKRIRKKNEYRYSATNEDYQILFKSVAETVWASCQLSTRFVARIRSLVSRRSVRVK